MYTGKRAPIKQTTIQFHPNTTYENFIGGLAPEVAESEIGFQFRPRKGELIEAASKAQDKQFLLHIDEINRADLPKVLGEAIYLFESEAVNKRIVKLPYDFGEPFQHILIMFFHTIAINYFEMIQYRLNFRIINWFN